MRIGNSEGEFREYLPYRLRRSLYGRYVSSEERDWGQVNHVNGMAE